MKYFEFPIFSCTLALQETILGQFHVSFSRSASKNQLESKNKLLFKQLKDSFVFVTIYELKNLITQ